VPPLQLLAPAIAAAPTSAATSPARPGDAGNVPYRTAAAGGCVSKAAIIESAQQEMSVMAKGNERVLRTHLSRVAQASGRTYLTGCQCQWLR
jgi:hypothetical protein